MRGGTQPQSTKPVPLPCAHHAPHSSNPPVTGLKNAHAGPDAGRERAALGLSNRRAIPPPFTVFLPPVFAIFTVAKRNLTDVRSGSPTAAPQVRCGQPAKRSGRAHR